MTSSPYDFIIVGAGSAGCVAADRLTACGRYKVLLLEAGGSDRRFWIKVPLGYAYTFTDPRVNWRFTARPDAGLNGREAYWPRGKVLGGSSSINAMAYLRGLPNDYDDWEVAGATGWNWANVRRQYEALECNDEAGPDGQRRRRGDGPVRVSELSQRMHPFSRNFIKAGAEMGWPHRNDLNHEPQEGLGFLRSTVRDGRRWSAADAFLRPAMKRPNLTVISNAMVTKVMVSDGRAKGVNYRTGGAEHQALAAREVILSSGAIGSPQLLQVSGIGPAAHLRDLGIQVVQDLPQVGSGLQDHLAVTHYFHANVPTLNQNLGNALGQLKAGIRYLLTRNGPLSVPVNQCSGYVRSSPDQPVPDVQFYGNPASYVVKPSGKPSIDREAGFLLSVQPCRPTSRGEIRIVSADPAEPPHIQPNSLATEEDRQTAIRASRLLRTISQTSVFRSLITEKLAPDITSFDDDGLLENFRNRAGTVFHPSCTCRMGNDAQDSVVDSRLRVHGVRGLRVIDASAFPNITSGNINAPTLMLAARGTAMVLEDAAAAQ